VRTPQGWGRWFAAQWGLFVVLGIVAGAMFWLARQGLVIGIVVGCFALLVGCVIGMKRLDRWLEARDAVNK
jgi:hypothetical protein